MNFLTMIDQSGLPSAIGMDTPEKVSFILLLPVRFAFGSMVENNQKLPPTLSARTICVIAFVILSPLLLPVTIVGVIFHLFSETH